MPQRLCSATGDTPAVRSDSGFHLKNLELHVVLMVPFLCQLVYSACDHDTAMSPIHSGLRV